MENRGECLMDVNLDEILADNTDYTDIFNELFTNCDAECPIGADMTKEHDRPSPSKCVPNDHESSEIMYELTDYHDPVETTKSSILDPPYNLSERQLRHSNQSAGSYRGVPRSYAELITLAIQSSPNQRLVLSDIYKWMYQNVPEFVDQRLPPSETSWKNSIRHNLSLHDKFVKEVNPASPKGSFWTIVNPNESRDCGYDSGCSTRQPSRRGSACNLGESIKLFQTSYKPIEDVLPQVVNKLEMAQSLERNSFGSSQPDISRSSLNNFPKRPRDRSWTAPTSTRPPTRTVGQKSRRNTICSMNTQRYDVPKIQMSKCSPNDDYPASACQDVNQIQQLYNHITDDQIMMDSCPTLIRLGIFRHLL